MSDSEIGNHRVARLEKDVVRLDIAVDHAVPVGVLQRICHLGDRGHRFVQPEPPGELQSLPQRFTVDVGHHVVEQAVYFTRVVQAEDMRMDQARGDLNLPMEAA